MFMQVRPLSLRGVNYSQYFIVNMYILKTLYIVLVPFFLILYNGSYEKNEDFFHANQAKDSAAGPRRFCILFLFFKFLQP